MATRSGGGQRDRADDSVENKRVATWEKGQLQENKLQSSSDVCVCGGVVGAGRGERDVDHFME